jgi:hypothetical protein
MVIYIYLCMCVCVGAMTTERTRPLVLHGGCHRHIRATHTHGAYFSLCTAQCICMSVCMCMCEYSHVRVLDDIIIIVWPIRYFVIFFLSAQLVYLCIT